MHFITGGAFNGKRAWVKKTYAVKKHDCWLTAYEHDPIPQNVMETNSDLLILEGVEIWIKELTKKYNSIKCRGIWNDYLDSWNEWERIQLNRTLVVIGTDITKGIVPLEKETRLWRDVTGWAYQDLASKAEKVDVIWYGLNQTIK